MTLTKFGRGDMSDMEQTGLRSRKGKLGRVVTLLSLAAVGGAVLVRSAWASAGGTIGSLSPLLLTLGIVGCIVGVLLVWMDATAPAD
jgi:hypothetical protein